MPDRHGRIAALGLLTAGALALTACSHGATRGGLIGGRAAPWWAPPPALARWRAL
ncbi:MULTISPECIES: hypothetical protein [Sphingobium]|uniref:hypothetical protein n=1 Tax=Sphingobium TaxID=165695 RepID=UPI000AC5B4F1|nr:MULTISPECIES: hypothetical protein [Sphingobium]UXC90204.1 hypothetical protein EGM87_14265 [Sphingobium sp. RSMS]WDA34596.1 hypothetical protein PO876_14015 [Sphingobium sp. YC-XJ3]